MRLSPERSDHSTYSAGVSMKRLPLLGISILLAACAESPTQPATQPNIRQTLLEPAPPGKNKIQCFTSGDATCTLNSNGAKGSATLTVNSVPADASVFYLHWNGSIYGALLSSITQLGFTYTGTAVAGSPRFSIPIDTNNDGLTDFWAYASAFYCNDGSGHVDVINDDTCTIFVSYNPLISYPNWAAFVAAQPANATVALTDNYLFAIADDVGSWTLNNVVIGKPGK
jgi:hypothetical protein